LQRKKNVIGIKELKELNVVNLIEYVPIVQNFVQQLKLENVIQEQNVVKQMEKNVHGEKNLKMEIAKVFVQWLKLINVIQERDVVNMEDVNFLENLF